MQQIKQTGRLSLGSLNTLVLSNDGSPIELMDTLASADRASDPDYMAMRESALARLRFVFDDLPPREQRVAILLHVGDLTLREASEVLGVSESRVCQIHGKLRRRLRARLEADAPMLLEVA
ncbi:MAG: sigma-70 family RNA polymerase sigma factor [Solirubrobacteraceae bacterium]